jgi:hypothetical protein
MQNVDPIMIFSPFYLLAKWLIPQYTFSPQTGQLTQEKVPVLTISSTAASASFQRSLLLHLAQLAI